MPNSHSRRTCNWRYRHYIYKIKLVSAVVSMYVLRFGKDDFLCRQRLNIESQYVHLHENVRLSFEYTHSKVRIGSERCRKVEICYITYSNIYHFAQLIQNQGGNKNKPPNSQDPKILNTSYNAHALNI